jgi:hypothetical protein
VILLSMKDVSCATRSGARSPAASVGMNAMGSASPSPMRRISRR